MRECNHENTKILKSYRPTKKISRFQAYNPPKKCTEICKDCSTKIDSWKPM